MSTTADTNTKKLNLIRRVHNEIMQYYSSPLPTSRAPLTPPILSANVYVTTTAPLSTLQTIVSANVFVSTAPSPTLQPNIYISSLPSGPPTAAAMNGTYHPFSTTATLTPKESKDFIFSLEYRPQTSQGDDRNIEMTVSVSHPRRRQLPKLFFELCENYPFVPPSMWICHEDSDSPSSSSPSSSSSSQKYTRYCDYIERTSVLIGKKRAVLNEELFDTWRLFFFRHCSVRCSSKVYPEKWKPTYHLIDLVDEFATVYLLKRNTLALFHVHSICEHKSIPHCIEKLIGSYLFI